MNWRAVALLCCLSHLAACGVDSDKTAEKACENAACPPGTTIELSASSVSECEASGSVKVLSREGEVDARCFTQGDCEYACVPPVCCGGEKWTTDSYECETPCCPDGTAPPCKTACGNGECEAGENPTDCPQDCGDTCGDGDCTGAETPDTCPIDCNDCVPECEAKECGNDGCAGSCGDCGDLACVEGQCLCGMTAAGTLNGVGNLGIHLVDNYAYVVDKLNGLQILDVSVPASPQLLGEIKPLGSCCMEKVVVVDDVAYVGADGGGLQLYSVETPSAPTELGTLDTKAAHNVVVLGDYVIVADGKEGLLTVDVSEPMDPTLVATLETDKEAWVLAHSGDRLYLGTTPVGFQVYDAANPEALVHLGGVLTPSVTDVEVSDNRAYVMDALNGEFIVYDVQDPSAITALAAVDLGDLPALYILNLQPNYAYVSGGDGLLVMSIADPGTPYIEDMFEGDSFRAVDVAGGFAFCTSSGLSNKLHVINLGDCF